jgi:glutamyl-tRNA synthetase
MTTSRLAPTPSGLLHLGNARSFLLAWLWARSQGGRVVMRIEDIDLPRCSRELRDQALEDIAWLGLDWDEGPHAGDEIGPYDQSTRFEHYRRALDKLIHAGKAYPCVCSRKDIEEATRAPHGDEGAIYPGTCRGRFATFAEAATFAGSPPAMRFAFDDAPISFTDEIAGPVTVKPRELGDFVLWRKDGLPSYQLAVTCDDAAMGITQVLRGKDLLLSTARQLALFKALALPAPKQWAHVPLMLAQDKRRLAKRDGDLSIKALRERGVQPEKVIGLCAQSAGLVAAPEAVSPRALLAAFSIKTVSNVDYSFPEEKSCL